MNGKKIYLLGAILIVIVGILVVQEKLNSKKPLDKELLMFPKLTEQSIGAITISEGTSGIRLKRKGDVWLVTKPTAGSTTAITPDKPLSPLMADSSLPKLSTVVKEYPVDSAAITSAIEKVTSLKKSELISENTEKQAIFEVDTTKGIVVEVFDNSGKSMGIVIIGKSGPDYNSNYIRQKGSNSVYMASGGIRYSLFTDLTRWRNKSILKFDKTTAQGLTLARNDGSMVTVAHADSGNPWEIIAPIKNPAKTEEVESIIDKLSQFTAAEFQDEPMADSAMGFDKPELGVTVSFKNGSSRNIVVGKKNSSNNYWVKIDGKEQIYLVGEYSITNINKKLDELKGEPLVKPVSIDSLKMKK